MKILAIRIRNLASLEGQTEIDFTAEPLRSAGIFAITGATGAGKSTILDALCLALYGKTPRYLQAREMGIEIRDVQGSTLSQGDVRSILRDGTAEGFAEVDFRGVDGQHYRATWSVRRARNRAEGSMQSDNITLKNITSDTPVPGRKQETLNEIARLVGLNFDQFTRSVLLAQGDFTAFMKANKDEKSSLLEKLTGTSVYSEISKKIYEKYKGEEQLLRDLDLRKQGIITLTEEELSVLLDEQATLETILKTLEQDIKGLTAEIEWHEQLAQMRIKYDEAQIAFLNATDIRTASLPRKQKLWAAEQAQQTRTWADALRNVRQQYSEKTNMFNVLKETLSTLHTEKEQLERLLNTTEHDLTVKNNAWQEALPLLEQARKLDTLLSEKKEQLDKAGKEAEQASEKSKEQKALLSKKREVLAALSTEIKTLSDWKTENTDRSAVAENRDIIISKLQDAQKLLEIEQSATHDLDVLNNKIKNKETEKTNLEARVARQQQEWEQAKKNYEDQSAILQLIPIERLENEKAENSSKVENTIEAKAHWQLFYSSQTEYEALYRKQLNHQADHLSKQKTLQTLRLQLAIEKAQKETAGQALHQARLASAENVEALRSALAVDEPCPVCGSTHHPYVLNNPQLENVLSVLENTFTEKEHLYLLSYRQHNALEQEYEMLSQTIRQQDEAIAVLKTVLEKRKEIWELSEIAKECSSIADADKADYIERQLTSLKIIQVDLQGQIQAYHIQRDQLQKDKQHLDHLKENADALVNRVKDTVTAITMFQEQQNGKILENNKAVSGLAEVEHTLSIYFNTPGWMESWKAAPADFTERINTFARKWKANTQNLEENQRNAGIAEATINEMEHMARTLAIAFTEKTEIFNLQQEDFKNLKQQRDSIFKGHPTEDIEVRLKAELSDAQQKLELLKTNQQQLNVALTKAHTQLEELTGILNGLQKDAETASGKINHWLNEYNHKNGDSLTFEQLYELLELSNEWIITERSAVQEIEEEVTKSSSVLAERKGLLDIHQQKVIAARPLDELTLLIGEAQSDAEQKKQKKGEISFRLQQDEMHKNRIGELLKIIEKQAIVTENWGKLNEIIGSADGKKFRQIAQEYTLDALLGYANIHLKALTSRYRIERIPASLGLQVVDQDMGDEIRTVYSLSGGESFLVSLALALGLASLSSSRMKVESLFIDEGFGSLDPTTLNIAMDALERLHNQGRKVGVISHVQEMTERIPVQIKVSKQQSGKSMVKVEGN
ncbi:AAA family ATPase [Chryseobacterium sp. SSA4.19]|uniref:AAA family ATPase n=1 Tax=Chryseobacterium sp. SSA4.19 TaxID=2919915 RepID=UPI001F4D75F4|nr:AAA family ATPase [Chryseobacterium sp. SSA4.19]MCJ8152773.1 AAA family ATPase [Chryseobacterium sp. SSA4.19]